MADEGEEQEGGEDVRMQLVQQYCLKTIKQVGNLDLVNSRRSIIMITSIIQLLNRVASANTRVFRLLEK